MRQELLEKLSRDPDSHKGENGRVGIVAGSRDYTGAPALAAKSALRTGCDLARILTSEEVHDVVASFSENLIVSGYSGGYFQDGDVESALELADWADVLAVGPGLSQPDSSGLKQLASEASVPLVVDADAIEPVIGADFGNAVFTPHRGEAEAIEREFGSIQAFVEEKGAVVVVKGPNDRIYAGGEVYEVGAGTAAMTVGGTGDVLTGIVASLISQGLELEEAARLGAWISGRAGELAEEKYGSGLVATDVVERVSEVMYG